MSSLPLKASQIKTEFSEFDSEPLITGLAGPDNEIKKIAAIETAGSSDLVFADKKEFVQMAIEKKPAAIVTSKEFADKLSQQLPESSILACANTGVAHALIKTRYADRNFSESEWGRVHPTAVIHETAEVSQSATVGPGAVIGARVKIGENSVVMANTVIEHDATIGNNTVIHPNVTIGYNCHIGNEVFIHAGTVIGSEGYGFSMDARKRNHRIPQTGNVVIEDRVRLGANNAVDRGAYAETRIGEGTKTDNLCHFAHNVTIGKDCLLTSGFIVAGSTKIGDRIIASGMTGILDHLEIPSDTYLLHKAGVNNTIKKPGAYAGTPVQPLDQYLKNVSAAKKTAEMKKTLSDLEKRIKELEK